MMKGSGEELYGLVGEEEEAGCGCKQNRKPEWLEGLSVTEADTEGVQQVT